MNYKLKFLSTGYFMKKIFFLILCIIPLSSFALNKFDLIVCEAQENNKNRTACLKELNFTNSCKDVLSNNELECYQERANEILSNLESFNIPSLFGKNIDTIKEILGQPKFDKERIWATGDDINDKVWKKEKTSLTISFHKNSREVINFFIDCGASNGACSDKNELLKKGNLKNKPSNYSVNFIQTSSIIKAKGLGNFTGIIITPIK